MEIYEKNKLKVLFVHHVSSIGGASWCLYEILIHLDREKYDPFVLLITDGPLAAKIRSLNIPVILEPSLPIFPVYGSNQILGFFHLLKTLILSTKGQKAFYNCLKNIRPDIVYFNSSAQLLLARTTTRANIGTVIYHNREHWKAKGILRIKLLIRNHIIANHIHKIFSFFLCGISQLGSPNISFLVRDWPSFENQVNYDVRRKYSIQDDTFLILVTGGTQKIKGTLDVLLASSKMLSKAKIAVIVLGYKERNISKTRQILMNLLNRTSYHQKIVDYSQNHTNIFLVPSTPDIISYLSACNVLVAPFHTSHAAKAALEAQLLGKPVILYDHPESHEYSLNGVSSLITPVAEIQRLASSLDLLSSNPKRALKMGLHGSQYVKSNFTSKKSMEIINHMSSIYKN